LCEYKRGVCTLEVHSRTKHCFKRDEAWTYAYVAP